MFYNINEFANSIGVSKPTATSHLKDGLYSYFKRGNRYFIPHSSIDMSNLLNSVDMQSNPMILNTTNQKGGVGKTTTSLNLATAYAFYGLRTLIVDNDIQGNASSINNEDSKESNDFKNNNLTNLLLKMDSMDFDELDEKIDSLLVHVENEAMPFKGTLDLLPNNFTAGEDVELFITRAGSETLLDRLLKRIKHNYDVIIIDNSPTLGTVWRMSVMASNATLVTLRPDKFSVDGLVGLLNGIKRSNNAYYDRHQKPINIIGANITVYDGKTNSDKFGVEFIQTTLEERGIELFKPFITRTTLVNDSQFFGGSSLYEDPISKTSGEYLELAYNIFKKFHLPQQK